MGMMDDIHHLRLTEEASLAEQKRFNAEVKVVGDSLKVSFASIADSLKRLADEWAPRMTGIVADPGDVTTH